MNTEPQEIRLRRSQRSEAVRLAARLVRGAHDAAAPETPSMPGVIDEAFADFTMTKKAAAKPVSVSPIDTVQIANQLKQLDEQRDRLASLLADLDPA